MVSFRSFACALAAGVVASPASADPFASQVVSYTQGTGAAAGYTNPLTALGSPERYTGEGVFPSAVTPFNSAFGTDEIVSIGAGGQLTLAFSQPVTNDPNNPFGIDLLIFGNAYFVDQSYPNGVAGPVTAEGGVVSVSADGTNWFEVTGVQADGAFPTLGYADLTDPYATMPGLVPTDFTRPVDPAFDPSGLSFGQIVAGYSGSGGGAGIDIGALGLSEISFVRIFNPLGSGVTPEIDAIADVSAVPAPSVLLALSCSLVCASRRRRN